MNKKQNKRVARANEHHGQKQVNESDILESVYKRLEVIYWRVYTRQK